jgi:SlyX protein
LAGAVFAAQNEVQYAMDSTNIEPRLTELEIKASFTEDLVDQLNLIITRQQDQIDALLREVAALRQQAPEAGAPVFRSLMDDLPPHY